MIASIGKEKRRRPAPRTRAQTRVSDVMSRELATIAPYALAAHAELIAQSRKVHHLLVVEDDRLAGVLCLCDLYGCESDAVAVELMSTPPATIDSGATLEDAIEAMRDIGIGCLPVLDGDDLVGVITRGDLRRAGFEDEIVFRTCASCSTRHHVRSAMGNAVAFCVDCMERGRAFDSEDPYDDLGDGD